MIIKEEQTTINYFGIKLFVTDRYNSVTTDKNGAVWAHSDKPYRDESEWKSDGIMAYICKVELDGMDWRDTLMEV